MNSLVEARFCFVPFVFWLFRFEKQMEVEQKAFEDSKNRMLIEFSAEKDRLLKEIHQKEQELEFQREKLLKDKKDISEHLNREFNEKSRMIEKRNQVCVCFFLPNIHFSYSALSIFFPFSFTFFWSQHFARFVFFSVLTFFSLLK